MPRPPFEAMREGTQRARLGAALAALLALLAVIGMALAGSGSAASDRAGSGDGGVTLTDLGSFDAPVYTTTAPGRQSRKLIFVVEQGGLVKVIRNGVVLERPFADLSERTSVGGERGLLSIAFDPAYAKNRRLYAYYTDAEGDIRVSGLRRSADSKVQIKPGYLRDVIEVPHSAFPNHNGGQASFGPDGNLWLATGDGGSSCDPDENAQNPESLLGKLLRISPKPGGGYAIPKGNPFASGAGADEIYALGLRNPFRFSFDAETETIAIGDVGQAAFEEVDYVEVGDARGANFGWDAFEGRDPYVPSGSCTSFDTPTTGVSGTVPPIHQYGHAGGDFAGCAIIGGPVVRDRRLPTLAGRYLFSDSCNGQIQSIVPRLGGASDPGPVGIDVESPSSITEGRNHRVYITDLIGGHVYRVDPAAGNAAAPAERLDTRRVGDGRGGFRAAKVGSFEEPVYVTGPKGAGGRLFVVEQPGVIEIVKNGRRAGTFLDIRNRVEAGGERGLLSVAFAPDYSRSGLLYVYFTEPGGDIVVQEYRRAGGNDDRANPKSARKVIEIEHSENSNHNGGQLQFGPDGLLYIGTGDGGSAYDPPENAQNRGSLLGKLLRIDPRRNGKRPYTVPGSNPFVGKDGQGEIYSLGLRNPFRFSFDRKSKALAIGDVGQDMYEEIDFETLESARGANFGWDAFEGFHRLETDSSPPPADAVPPILEYSHAGGNCSVTGGFVSRDKRIPSLFGRYLYADFCKGQIRSLVPEFGGARGDSATGLPSTSGVSSFGEDSKGHLYWANLQSGEVFAIRPARGK